jgi:transposase
VYPYAGKQGFPRPFDPSGRDHGRLIHATLTAPDRSVLFIRTGQVHDPWGKQVFRVKFAYRDCIRCLERTRCTKSKTAARSLTLRQQPEQEAIQQGRQTQQSAEWKQRYKKRAGIEGTISQGVRAIGFRRARYIGLAKTHLQHLATAAALNARRIAAWATGQPRAKTRVSHFAALAA